MSDPAASSNLPPVQGFLPLMIKKVLKKVTMPGYCSLLCCDRFVPFINGHDFSSNKHWSFGNDNYGKPMFVNTGNSEKRQISLDEPIELTEDITSG